jgi:hypothetical protein
MKGNIYMVFEVSTDDNDVDDNADGVMTIGPKTVGV